MPWLLRELLLYDSNDADSAYVLVLFDTEGKAREREQDPRRAEGQAALEELMANAVAGQPQFTDFTVDAEWVPER